METESSTPASRIPLSVVPQVQPSGLNFTAVLKAGLARKSAAAVLVALKPEGTALAPNLIDRAKTEPALRLYFEDFSEEAYRSRDVDRLPKLIAAAGLPEGDEQAIERAENEGWPQMQKFGPAFFWEAVRCRA
jgi:hypothetical protein